MLDIPPQTELDLKVSRVSFDEILRMADYVTLHVPLTDLTHHMIDAKALGKMKAGSMLINCARGPIVCEDDLIETLRAGHLGGAGLDVFEIEPPVAPNRFAEFSNVVLTPHHAPGTRDTMIVKFQEIFSNADRFFKGERMENEISLL